MALTQMEQNELGQLEKELAWYNRAIAEVEKPRPYLKVVADRGKAMLEHDRAPIQARYNFLIAKRDQ